jgi:hypothetical protein
MPHVGSEVVMEWVKAYCWGCGWRGQRLVPLESVVAGWLTGCTCTECGRSEVFEEGEGEPRERVERDEGLWLKAALVEAGLDEW